MQVLVNGLCRPLLKRNSAKVHGTDFSTDRVSQLVNRLLMASSFLEQKRLSCKTYTPFDTWFLCLQIVCPVLMCPKIKQDKIFIKF